MGNVNMEAKQIHDRTEAGKRQSVAEHLAALDAVAKKIDDMPTYTSVDRAFLDEWETNLPILANDVSNLGTTKANQITIAPFFNAETAYDPGDIVYYNGLSYRCVNAHEGEWDADDFAATTIDNELSSLNSNLTNKIDYRELNIPDNLSTINDAINYLMNHINTIGSSGIYVGAWVSHEYYMCVAYAFNDNVLAMVTYGANNSKIYNVSWSKDSYNRVNEVMYTT